MNSENWHERHAVSTQVTGDKGENLCKHGRVRSITVGVDYSSFIWDCLK